MEKVFDAIAKVGEYEQNGEKKAEWFTIGPVFKNENGELCMKIKAMPVGNTWNGWVAFKTPNANNNGNGNKPSTSAKTQVKTNASTPLPVVNDSQSEDKKDEELPF